MATFIVEDFCSVCGIVGQVNQKDIPLLSNLKSFIHLGVSNKNEMLNENEICQMVSKNGLDLKKVHPLDQTEAVCIAAVEESAQALKYVIHQTPRIVRAALKKDGDVWSYVHTQSIELHSIAAKTNTLHKKFALLVKNVEWDGRSLQYLKRTDRKLCLKVVLSSGLLMDQISLVDVRGDNSFWGPVVQMYKDAIKYCTQTIELCTMAVQASGLALEHIVPELQDTDNYERLCIMAVTQNPMALRFVHTGTILPDSVYVNAIRDVPSAFQFCSHLAMMLRIRLCKIMFQAGSYLHYASQEIIREMCDEDKVIAIFESLTGSQEERIAQVCHNPNLSITTKRRLLTLILSF